MLDRPRSSLPNNKFLVQLFALSSNCGPFLFAPNRLADYLNDHKHLRANPTDNLKLAVYEADHFIRTEGTPHQRAAIAIAGPSGGCCLDSTSAQPPPTPLTSQPFSANQPANQPRNSSQTFSRQQLQLHQLASANPAQSFSRQSPQQPSISLFPRPVHHLQKSQHSPQPPLPTKNQVPRDGSMPNASVPVVAGAQVNSKPPVVSIAKKLVNNLNDFKMNPLVKQQRHHQEQQSNLSNPSKVIVPNSTSMNGLAGKNPQSTYVNSDGSKRGKENSARLPKPPPVIDRIIQSAHQLNTSNSGKRKNKITSPSNNVAANDLHGTNITNNPTVATIANSRSGATVTNNRAGATITNSCAGATVTNNTANAPITDNQAITTIGNNRRSVTIGEAVQRAATAVIAASKHLSADAQPNPRSVPNATLKTELSLIRGNTLDNHRPKAESNLNNTLSNDGLAIQMQNCSVNTEVQHTVVSSETTITTTGAAHVPVSVTTSASAPSKPSIFDLPKASLLQQAEPASCMLKLRLRPAPSELKRRRVSPPTPPPRRGSTPNHGLAAAQCKVGDMTKDQQQNFTDPPKKRTPDRGMAKMPSNNKIMGSKNGETGENEIAPKKVSTPRRSHRASTGSTSSPPTKRKRFNSSIPKPGDNSAADAPAQEPSSGDGVDEKTRALLTRLLETTAERTQIMNELLKEPMFVDKSPITFEEGLEDLKARRDETIAQATELQLKRRALESKIVTHQELVESARKERDELQSKIAEARKVIREQDKAKAKLSRELAESAAS